MSIINKLIIYLLVTVIILITIYNYKLIKYNETFDNINSPTPSPTVKKFCTTKPKTDGFGSQFQTFLCSIIVAETTDHIYIHTPIKEIEHNYDNNYEYINKIEYLMNIKNNYKSIDSLTNDEKIYLEIYDMGNTYNIFENNIDYYLDSSSFLNYKQIFWKNKDKHYFKNNKKNAAVHIRRGDVSQRENTDRYLDNTHYISIMKLIKDKYPHDDLLYHIYSEGNIDDFKEFNDLKDYNIIFHLNEDIFNTFTGLVAAEILITSKSSFSYAAALLSDGEIYHKRFWHKPSKKWIVFE